MMMRRLLLILCFPLATYAQKIPDFGIGKVRITLTDKTVTAELTANNNREIKPKTDKTYYWYGSNAIHATQGGYSGRLLNGQYTEYFLNKNMKEQGNFKEGLKTGVWKKWDQDGNLTETSEWRKGVQNGEADIYLRRDSIRVINYEDGKPAGHHRTLLQRLHLSKKDSARVKESKRQPTAIPPKPHP